MLKKSCVRSLPRSVLCHLLDPREGATILLLLSQAECNYLLCVLQAAVSNPGASVVSRFRSAGAFSFGTSQRSQILNVRF